jgi:hypothetical protein
LPDGFLVEFGMENADFGLKNRGVGVSFACISNIWLEIDGFLGLINCAFAAYLCAFFATLCVSIRGVRQYPFRGQVWAGVHGRIGVGEAHNSIMRFLVIILRKPDLSFFALGGDGLACGGNGF